MNQWIYDNMQTSLWPYLFIILLVVIVVILLKMLPKAIKVIDETKSRMYNYDNNASNNVVNSQGNDITDADNKLDSIKSDIEEIRSEIANLVKTLSQEQKVEIKEDSNKRDDFIDEVISKIRKEDTNSKNIAESVLLNTIMEELFKN